MGAFGRTKSKEPEKWKPVWQVPSKEVAKIFDSATKARISETGVGGPDDKTLEEGVHQPASVNLYMRNLAQVFTIRKKIVNFRKI